jgi:hypothetical protein
MFFPKKKLHQINLNKIVSKKVWFKIYGTAGIWEATQLRPNRTNVDAKFTPGSLVEIDLEGPVIGDLKRIKIWVKKIVVKV